MMPQLLLVNGPNLNLLGTREPALYGTQTLDDVVDLTVSTAAEFGFTVRAVQSNHEGVLIDVIHESRHDCAAVIVNLGALTHTSVALRDALTGIGLPIAEVHITNVHARESFRGHSYISPIATSVIVGAGILGYAFAVQSLARIVS
jgi:3-dehydroquinate dehydratase-2